MAKKKSVKKDTGATPEKGPKRETLLDRLKDVPEENQRCRLVQMDGFVQYFFVDVGINGSTADSDEIKFLKSKQIKEVAPKPKKLTHG